MKYLFLFFILNVLIISRMYCFSNYAASKVYLHTISGYHNFSLAKMPVFTVRGSILSSEINDSTKIDQRWTQPVFVVQNKTQERTCRQDHYIAVAECMYSSVKNSTSNKFVFIMMANKAFLPFIRNWLCNTAKMPGVHSRTLLLFSDHGDREMEESPFNVRAIGVNSLLLTELNADLDYDTFGYWRLVQHRVQVILNLTRANISFLLFEPDALWVQNPLFDPALQTDSDLIGFDDNRGVPGFGWLRVLPNLRVTQLFTELENKFSAQIPNYNTLTSNSVLAIQGEQDILHTLIQSQRSKPYKDLTFQMLSRTKYTSGKWYDGGRGGNGRSEREACKANGLPFVINNNWIIGNLPKITRARRWGHWFVQDNVSGSCSNSRLLQETFDQMLNSMHTLRPLHGDPLPTECPKC